MYVHICRCVILPYIYSFHNAHIVFQTSKDVAPPIPSVDPTNSRNVFRPAAKLYVIIYVQTLHRLSIVSGFFSMERDIPHSHRDTPGTFLFIHFNSKYFNFISNNAISFQLFCFIPKNTFSFMFLKVVFKWWFQDLLLLKTNCFSFFFKYVFFIFLMCVWFCYFLSF